MGDLRISDLMHGGWHPGDPDSGLEPPRPTYQLWITVHQPLGMRIGRLGVFSFLPGRYVYTGSARRHLAARLTRHLSRDKRLRWHIDYLLVSPRVVVTAIYTFDRPECEVNRATPGKIPVRGFGASDCRARCGGHLKYLGRSETATSMDQA